MKREITMKKTMLFIFGLLLTVIACMFLGAFTGYGLWVLTGLEGETTRAQCVVTGGTFGVILCFLAGEACTKKKKKESESNDEG